MKKAVVALALVAGLVGGAIGAKVFVPGGGGGSGARESAFARVMRTGVLRCSYGISPPVVIKDPSTGKLSGLYVELMDAMAAMAGLKMEWPAEVDWGQVGSALDSGKSDVFCGGMWPDSKRARGMGFIRPFFYNSVGLLVRSDDARFPASGAIPAGLANNASFTACVLEGDVTQAVVVSDLPNAKTFTVPQMASWGDMITALQSKKCDFLIAPAMVGFDIRAQKLPVRYSPTQPALRNYGVVPVVGRGEPELRQYLDAVVDEFLGTPAYDRIMKKYEAQYPGTMGRPAVAYQEAR